VGLDNPPRLVFIELMHALPIVHSIASLLTLIIGLFAWRLTSSRSVIFLAFFGSAALLFSASLVQSGKEAELTFIIPFLVFALFSGRAIGFGVRSREEIELRMPGILLASISLVALGVAVATFINT